MKKYIYSLCLVALVGCASGPKTFQNVAGKFLVTTSLTVDVAMHGWAVYVATGKATPQDESTVRLAYSQYQTDFMIATNAYNLAVKVVDSSVFTGPSNTLFLSRSKIITTTTKQ